MAGFADVQIKVDFDFSEMDKLLDTAIQRGINRGVQRSKGEAQRRITKQNSLAGAGKWKVINASISNLEAALVLESGRADLASFALNTPAQSKREGAVRLRVKPGKTVTIKNMFFMKKKDGSYILAKRLRPGQRVPNRKKPKFANKKGLAFGFSGPSADQMFVPGYANKDTGIAAEMAQWTADVATQETFRQLDRLMKNSSKK